MVMPTVMAKPAGAVPTHSGSQHALLNEATLVRHTSRPLTYLPW
jgi:hypothetical protein